MLSIQGWLFGVYYVESSIKSGKTTFLSLTQAIRLKWGVVICYFVFSTVCLVLGLLDFKYLFNQPYDEKWLHKSDQLYTV